MLNVIEETGARTLGWQVGPASALTPSDVVAAQATASSGAWDVEHAFDPTGDLSIMVLPTCDDPALPTFLLYQEHGLARVATIRREIWESDQAFPSGRRAVAAIVAATAAVMLAA